MSAGIDLLPDYVWRTSTRFDDLIGQKRAVEALRGWLRSNESGTLLLHGPTGTGKKTLAKLMGTARYCERRLADESPCGTCDSCKHFEMAEYPLGFVYFDAANSVSDKVLRNFVRSVNEPGIAESQFIIVDNVDFVAPEKIDIFLKTLEDAPEATFVLIATNLQSVRPAVVSRCKPRLQFRRLIHTDMTKLAERAVAANALTLDEDVFSLAVAHSDGLPGRLREALIVLHRAAARSPHEAAVILGINWADDFVAYCLAIMNHGGISLQGRAKVAGPDRDESMRRLHLFLTYLYQAVVLGEDWLGQAAARFLVTNTGALRELVSEVNCMAGRRGESAKELWRDIASRSISSDWTDAAAAIDELFGQLRTGVP